MKDKNFDELAERFIRNIYQEKRGQLRLAIVKDDLFSTIPALRDSKRLKILDAGCGFSPLAESLLDQGHQLSLCDISSVLLDQAKDNLSSHRHFSQVEFLHESAQQVLIRQSGEFDLVLFHAVLEWVADPLEVLQKLTENLKPGACLSLLFYNRNTLVYRNLIKGNLRKVKSENYTRDPGSLTPTNPIDPQMVYSFVESSELEVLCHSGVRTFFDLMDRKLREKISFDDLYEQERKFSQQMPFRDLGRYIHMVLYKGGKSFCHSKK